MAHGYFVFLAGLFLFVSFTSADQEFKASQKKFDELFYNDGPPADWKTRFSQSSITKVDSFLDDFKNRFSAKKEEVNFDMKNNIIREDTIKLVHFLFSAENFQEFYEFASVLKNIVNREQLTYSIAVVSTHRTDINLQIPPWYKTFPNYFFRNSVLQQLVAAKNEGVESLTVDVEYEKDAQGLDKLRYFREDPGLSNAYYNWQIHWPVWLNPGDFGLTPWSRRGQLFHHINMMIASRYALELHVNDMDSDLLDLRYAKTLFEGKNPFDGDLLDSHGNKIPVRQITNETHISDETKQVFLKVIEFLDTNQLHLKDGRLVNASDYKDWTLSCLGDTVFNTSDSLNPDFYQSPIDSMFKSFAYGKDPATGKVERYAMGYPMSMLRDHSTYQTLALLDDIFTSNAVRMYGKNILEQMSFPGVTITGFDVDPLQTYFEPVTVDVGRWMGVGEGKYKIRYNRLNHVPFTLRLNVTNSKNDEGELAAMARVFLALDYYNLPSNLIVGKLIFTQIDRFPLNLKPGLNIVERDSSKSTSYENMDPEALAKKFETQPKKARPQCGLPDNLMLPKGRKEPEGLGIILLVMVSPMTPGEDREFDRHMENMVTCGSNPLDDGRPLAFPYERHWPPLSPTDIPSWTVQNLTVHHITQPSTK